MVTREHRLSEFNTKGEPASGTPVELLCEDHNGTYVLPFPCHRVGGAWHAAKSGQIIEAIVLGWRKSAAILALMMMAGLTLLTACGTPDRPPRDVPRDWGI